MTTERRSRGKTEKLRILHVIPRLGGGGTERVVLTLLPLFDPSELDCSLCVMGSENAFPERAKRVSQIKFLRKNGSLRSPIRTWGSVKALRTAIRQQQPDIVHSHLWPAARACTVAARGLAVRHVVHIHDTRPWLSGVQLRDRLYRVLTNTIVSRAPVEFIAVSEAVKRYTAENLRISGSAIRVIPNGVDLSEFRPRNRCEPSRVRLTIGTVALFKPEKGHRYLIEACAKLVADGCDCELRLAGDGELRPYCEELSRSLALGDRVRFNGLVDDVAGFLSDLDVFVLPSLFGEGMPMTILEAMACELPVVATDVAGACEVITSGINGVLVPPKDAEALAAALKRLAGSSDERKRLARDGLLTVQQKFSFEGVARRIESVYKQVTGRIDAGSDALQRRPEERR